MCAEHVEEMVDVQLVMELVSMEQNKFWNTTNIIKQTILFIKIYYNENFSNHHYSLFNAASNLY